MPVAEAGQLHPTGQNASHEPTPLQERKIASPDPKTLQSLQSLRPQLSLKPLKDSTKHPKCLHVVPLSINDPFALEVGTLIAVTNNPKKHYAQAQALRDVERGDVPEA